MNCGTDICSVSRMKEAIDRKGDHFIERVFSEKERAYCEARKHGRYESYAGKFAVKEAVYKAISPSREDGGAFTEVEVLNTETGAPYVKLHGELQELAGERKICVSVSHEKEFAIAMAVIE